ncbi:hypothetical protein TRIUR3_21442 [Triticum urartu]|uniref:Uncharacterized protein n=2 Tax=Triticum TaxID=4564 RepID=A0A9R0XVK8_TRITD|nr:hypothetical protein TRIUR3_21442 [Triticum urartu]VAI43266.1 unnamed protein product [Triticum turgidum subsp. durum]
MGPVAGGGVDRSTCASASKAEVKVVDHGPDQALYIATVQPVETNIEAHDLLARNLEEPLGLGKEIAWAKAKA